MVPPLPLAAFVPLARASGPWSWVHTQPFPDRCVRLTVEPGTPLAPKAGAAHSASILGVTVLCPDFASIDKGVPGCRRERTVCVPL